MFIHQLSTPLLLVVITAAATTVTAVPTNNDCYDSYDYSLGHERMGNDVMILLCAKA